MNQTDELKDGVYIDANGEFLILAGDNVETDYFKWRLPDVELFAWIKLISMINDAIYLGEL